MSSFQNGDRVVQTGLPDSICYEQVGTIFAGGVGVRFDNYDYCSENDFHHIAVERQLKLVKSRPVKSKGFAQWVKNNG